MYQGRWPVSPAACGESINNVKAQAVPLAVEQHPESKLRDYGGRAMFLAELWDSRELFYFLAWRDVKVRYKQTALGVLWAIIQPLLTMAIFMVLFGRIARIPTDGVPPSLFYFTALLPWLYVSATVGNASMSLISNSTLLTKIYFPRIIMPAAASLSGLLDFFIGSLLMVGLMVYFHVTPSWKLLLWPVLVALMFALALGIGMFLSAVNVKYRDVKYAVPFAIQLWMFLSPIIYPTSMVPARFRWLLLLNPLSGLIEGFRGSLLVTRAIPWESLGISALLTMLILVSAALFFKRSEDVFADII